MYLTNLTNYFQIRLILLSFMSVNHKNSLLLYHFVGHLGKTASLSFFCCYFVYVKLILDVFLASREILSCQVADCMISFADMAAIL